MPTEIRSEARQHHSIPNVGGTSTNFEGQVVPIIAQNTRTMLAGDAASRVDRVHA
jgi:hypothetical protein